ncbi:MAG: hypothetical protein JWM09_1294 [Francisellaceae bacterium]|nr:hypothetical protein [Francisellaceae bacterium]
MFRHMILFRSKDKNLVSSNESTYSKILPINSNKTNPKLIDKENKEWHKVYAK